MTRHLLALAVVAVSLAGAVTMASTAHAAAAPPADSPAAILHACGTDPATETFEQFIDDPVHQSWGLALFYEGPPTLASEEAAHPIQKLNNDGTFSFVPPSEYNIGDEVSQEQELEREQDSYAMNLGSWEWARDTAYPSCVAQQKQKAADAKQAKDDAAAARAAARADARLYRATHCAQVVNWSNGWHFSVWRSGSSVPCSVARQLALRIPADLAGWHRTAYFTGYNSSELVTRIDSHGELHTFRVPTDWYTEAFWRHGSQRVVIGAGPCFGQWPIEIDGYSGNPVEPECRR